jgi:tellurite methyltransferase
MSSYDKDYQTPNLFGEPYPALLDFFQIYPQKGSVLDVGCGQGRDVIPLAKMDYTVTGIDNSHVGIDQMLEKSKQKNLPVKGKVCDLYQFQDYQNFDIIILDSMLHFYKKDFQKETGLIKKIINQIKMNAVLCVCIQDVSKKVKILKETISASGFKFNILHDSKFSHSFQDQETNQLFKSNYCMYVVQKMD